MTPSTSLPLVAIVLLALVLTVPLSWADEHDEEPFVVGRLFFQLNDTDGDLGIHLLIDGEPWKTLEIDDPRDRRILLTNLQGRLRRQGLTEFKFESAEPDFETVPADRFFRRFPEGEYDLEARRLDGGEYETTALISHVLPAPPMVLSVDGMEIDEECEEVVTTSLSTAPELSWEAVTMSHPMLGTLPPTDIGIVRYEVAVERDEVVDEDTGMLISPPLKLEANLEVLPGEHVVTFQMPPDLLSPEDEIKFQILVQAENGNETSAESCFVVGGVS
jgi:hypothetical protein